MVDIRENLQVEINGILSISEICNEVNYNQICCIINFSVVSYVDGIVVF